MEPSEQKFQLRSRESRWRPATEVDGFRRQRKSRALLIEIAQYRFAKSPGLRSIQQIFVKRAVRTKSRAKGDVNIDMSNCLCCRGPPEADVACIYTRFRSRHGCHHSARVVIRGVTHTIAWFSLDMTELRKVTLILVCAIASGPAQTPPQAAPTPSIVYSVHDPAAIKDYRTNPRIVREMVNRLVLAATGQPDVGKAWASLVAPNDKVGIKICAAGGELFTTHHDIVNAIVDGLTAAGHPRGSIIVWDRSLGGVKEAGYRPSTDGYQLKAIAPREGYDPKTVLSAPLLGKLIWGDSEYIGDLGKMPMLSDSENTSNVSHFSKILSTEVDKVINVPVMSISERNGIAGCIYNMTIPNIDNWRRFAQGSRFGAESLAEIYANPIIAKKVVFNVMDGLIAQYAGGPQPQPNYAIHHATLYASKDPVALDAVALKYFEQWRTRGSLPAIGPLAAYISYASQIGLGNSAPNRIEVKNIGR